MEASLSGFFAPEAGNWSFFFLKNAKFEEDTISVYLTD